MIILLTIVFILSTLLTGLLRRYALNKEIIDMPNHRSSHTKPTPRGGGVSFVISFLLCIPVLFLANYISARDGLSLLTVGLLIAAIGFTDDHFSISPLSRLFGQAIVSAVALYVLNGMAPIAIGNWLIPLVSFIALLYLVWMINLYNFMDGIDGLAALEAIIVCGSAAFIYGLQSEYTMMFLPLTLASAVGGFLCWNFPCARIFMGDAGSGFLGGALAILSIQAAWVNSNYFWAWLILLGVFIVDATLTLMRRALNGERIYEAHRSHAYQHAASYFHSHSFVSMAVLVINLIWLSPIAILVGCGYLNGPMGLILAYLPLLVLASYFNAGKSTLRSN